MTFVASTAPDITEGLPLDISTRTTAATTVTRGRTRWDVSIGGIGFTLAASDSLPYQRSSAPVQKQQFDTSPEAGEQTLSGYWLRSQTSWHHGAGVNFYEPGVTDSEVLPSRYRFASSVGVDPWNIGELRLLKKTSRIATTASSTPYVAGARVSGADVYFTSDGTLKRWSSAGASTAYTGGTATTKPAICGSKVLVGDGTTIYSGDASGSTLASLYGSAPAVPTPYWVKNRVIATAGNKVFELALDGSTNAGTFTGLTALMTHSDASWTWTDVADAPGAILAAGYSGGVGAIYAFTLTDSGTAGGSPVLSNGFQVAEFPPGEEVHSIKVYLGAYIGIGTSRGLRVGLVAADGKIQYGPLLFKTTNPVKSLAARDSFLYAAVTGDIDAGSGCARVDLSSTVGSGSLIFPWAYDAQTHTSSTITSLTFLGTTEQVVLAAAADGFYAQSATDYETSGYLTSGAIRFATTEPKAFRAFDLRAQTGTSTESVAVSIIDSGGGETSLFTLSAGKDGSNISLSSIPEGQEYASYKLTLASATTVTPLVESIAVKALPGAQPQMLIQYPVLIADKMTDSGGAKYGRRGYAAALVGQLEQLFVDQTVIQVEDYTYMQGESYPAVVESFEFIRTTPPDSGPDGSNFGGVGKITVRRLL